MATRIGELDGERFDVAIIGGGINGASAARQLAAAGYRCLMAEKGDFASGASGRSSRMLHCGLRYFETPRPLRDFALRPHRFLQAMGMARQAMLARAGLVRDCGPAARLPLDRPPRPATDDIGGGSVARRGGGAGVGASVQPFTMCFPVWRGGPVAGWHLGLGLRLLRALGPGDVPLGDRRLSGRRLAEIPFLGDFRAPEALASAACYTEYIFDWPERFCLDAVLDAEQNGAVVRNHCPARLNGRDPDGLWRIGLDGQATVRAPLVLVMAGTWIDAVLEGTGPPLVRGTKGTHILVRMPDAYRGWGVATMHRGGHPFYLVPLHGDLFYFGPTETAFEGDATEARATDGEIDFLIGEANHLLPGRGLTRRDVELTWAGVRPLTHDPALPMGNRHRVLHDLGNRGMEGVLAMTAGPIMTHRSAGRLALEAVARRLPRSGGAPATGHRPFAFAAGGNAAPVCDARPEVTAADIETAARREHAKNLGDILIRRAGLLPRRHLTRAEAEAAARIAAPALGWTEADCTAEVDAFLALQARLYRRPGG